MKKLLLLLLLPLFIGCVSEEEQLAEQKKTYYLNENFLLIDRSEYLGVENNKSKTMRRWKIQRQVSTSPDTIEYAEITNTASGDSDCGCNNSFVISEELWYNRPVGSILHFEYIRRDRFFKVYVPKSVVVKEEDIVEQNPKTINGDDNALESERKRLELERQLLGIQRELDKLKK